MNEQIIQTLLQKTSSRILEGVPPQESAAVAAAFERLLRLAMDRDRSYVQSYIPDLDAFTLSIGKNIVKEISEVPPEKRLEHIQRELLDREISSLDRRALKLAEQSLYASSADLSALRAKVQPIQQRIEELYREFKTSGMDWERRYGLTLSEASLDCGFVLGKHHYSSMRLGRSIESLIKLEKWPPTWFAELWLKDKDNK
jgi:hypothetical protein